MKTLVLKFCRWLLPLLGISAVSCDSIIQTAEEYGVPYADFEVKGRVIDAGQSQPVTGIKVSALSTDAGYSDEALVTGTTDNEGRFTLSGSFFPAQSIKIKAEDIDGEENGGSFSSMTVTVPLDKTGDSSGWYSGKFTAENVEITITQSISSEW